MPISLEEDFFPSVRDFDIVPQLAATNQAPPNKTRSPWTRHRLFLAPTAKGETSSHSEPQTDHKSQHIHDTSPETPRPVAHSTTRLFTKPRSTKNPCRPPNHWVHLAARLYVPK